jgi:hypothetical protein
MTLKNTMAGIDANIDDLQSGIEAGRRVANRLEHAAEDFNRLMDKRLKNADLVGTLARHARELQACARDQCGAMKELRESMVHLREELNVSKQMSRQLQDQAADRGRD